MSDKSYKVKWILVPTDHSRHGLYGTTTHHGATPAVAALSSAETILKAIPDAPTPCELQVLGVFGDDGENLLSDDDLRTTLRYHHRPLPCSVAFRPLC